MTVTCNSLRDRGYRRLFSLLVPDVIDADWVMVDTGTPRFLLLGAGTLPQGIPLLPHDE